MSRRADFQVSGGKTQDRFVVKIAEPSGLRSLKIDPGFAAKGHIDDDPLQVVVGSKTDAERFAISCRQAGL